MIHEYYLLEAPLEGSRNFHLTLHVARSGAAGLFAQDAARGGRAWAVHWAASFGGRLFFLFLLSFSRSRIAELIYIYWCENCHGEGVRRNRVIYLKNASRGQEAL